MPAQEGGELIRVAEAETGDRAESDHKAFGQSN